MVNKGSYLQPFWADLFNHYIFCGFTLPSMGNMALTRESLNGHTTNYNKEKILTMLEAKDFSLFSPLQTHSADYIEVLPDISNCGRYTKNDALEGDAAITENEKIMLLTTWADCIPVILYSPGNNIVATIHSGWKGTYKQIINNVLSFFHKKGTNFEQLYAAVGPGIKKCCYEVGDDFLNYFNKFQNVLFERRKDKLFFDLSYCVYLQLIECGVKESNIDYCSYCTCCNEEPIFSSYRREKNLFQGQAAFIGMKKKYE